MPFSQSPKRCCLTMVRFLTPGLLIGVSASCSRPEGKETHLPPLPHLIPANYRPQFRSGIEKAYQQAQAKPADAEANGRLGMLFHAFGQMESAEICYRRAHVLDPRRFPWAYYLGLVCALDGKNEEAAASLREATKLDAGYVPALLKLAEVLLSLNRYNESREICQAILSHNPDVAPAYYWWGRVDSAEGHAEAAQQHYRKACELWPSYGTAHYALALAYQKTGRHGEAQLHMTAYQKYKADSDPQPEDPQLDAVRSLDNSGLAHLMKGVDLENAGQIEQAIAEHEEAIRQDPKLAQASANLIALYARAGLPEKAEAAYRATIAINANLAQSHYDYGVLMIDRQRFREAEAAFRTALECSPHYAEAHSNLGAMLERRGRLDDAVRQYRAAVENRPNFRQAHYQLGHLLLMQKKPAEAISELSQTLTPEDGDTARFMYALGVAYAQVKDYPNAERYLEQSAGKAVSSGQEQLAGQVRTVLTSVRQVKVEQARK